MDTRIDLGEVSLDLGFQIALGVVGFLIMLIGAVSLTTSVWLSLKYAQFNRKENSVGMTGEEVARKILDDNDLQKIKVKVTG